MLHCRAMILVTLTNIHCLFLTGTFFHRMYHETEGSPAHKNAENVKKLLFCSGKVYYELVNERHKRELDDEIAIARMEQVNT